MSKTKIEKKFIKGIENVIDDLEVSLKALEAAGFDDTPYYFDLLQLQNKLIIVKVDYD